MKIFSSLYEKTLQWSAHPQAPRFLSALSFAESSFFPVPPDVMLAPMCLAKRHRAWRFALLATIFSVLGGLLGYALGALAFDLIEPMLKDMGYWNKFEKARFWFEEWGVWVVLLAGFSPIPYKVFTISAGVVGMALIPFVLMSLIGRGGRFFLVAGLMYWGGEKMEQALRKYVEWLGWLLIIGAVLIYFLVK
ncbi:MAG TPA: DedA family protein [Gammaproteobacteria bacterium]|nr:DedA family protein [Gammaproteobacteria bacterium]